MLVGRYSVFLDAHVLHPVSYGEPSSDLRMPGCCGPSGCTARVTKWLGSSKGLRKFRER